MTRSPGHAFVQIGAGAGDNDPLFGMRDGFTEMVKHLALAESDRVVLVEANPANESALRECWVGYPQVEIHMSGIVADSGDAGRTTFYWAEEDAPHFQVFSTSEAQVRAHFPNGTIRTTQVDCITISEFLEEAIGSTPVELLAIDIEGLDAAVMLAIPWGRGFDCHLVSFEHIHLGDQYEPIIRRLTSAVYIHGGRGLDINGYDVLFVKPASSWERVRYAIRGTSWRLDKNLRRTVRKVPLTTAAYEAIQRRKASLRS